MKLGYKDWVEGAPTSAKEDKDDDKDLELHCGSISINGWKDGLCATQLPFICKKWESKDMMRNMNKNRKWRSSAAHLAGSMIAVINIASMLA